MCGIAGVIALSCDGRPWEEPLEVIARRMSDCLIHRGPDGSGTWSSADGAVALAHRRLAIVDLSERGRQPMSFANKRYWIAFNGEIYNFRDLSSQLQSLGHRFASDSDTEVLLAAIAEWGIDAAIKRLVGMFAFAAWDEQERVLHLARDRMGEKPLYLGMVNGHLFFASELRAFRVIPGFQARVSPLTVAGYLRDGCVPGLLSMYEGVYKLPPASIVTVRANGNQRLSSQWISPVSDASNGELRYRHYWSCVDAAVAGRSSLIRDEHEATEHVERLLSDAVRMQMHADVPSGAFLSGGIDSTTVVALMQKQATQPIHTFTVAFDNPRFDESRHARAIAERLGTKHEEFELSESEIVRRIPSLVSALDEPTANASFFPVYLISERARTRVTVILSGDGGDELFGGYNRYAMARRAWRTFGWMPRPLRLLAASLLSRSPGGERGDSFLTRHTSLGGQVSSSAALAKLARVLSSHSLAESYGKLASCWDDLGILREPQALPARSWHAGLDSDLSRMLLADQTAYLPDDGLAKVDRASMAVSLETRLPLLDHRLLEMSWRLPDQLKLDDGITKRVLRNVLYRHVPRELVERRKMGFTVPLDAWMTGPLRDWSTETLRASGFLESLPFEAGAVEGAWNRYLSRRRPASYPMWSLVMLAAWMNAASMRA